MENWNRIDIEASIIRISSIYPHKNMKKFIHFTGRCFSNDILILSSRNIYQHLSFIWIILFK